MTTPLHNWSLAVVACLAVLSVPLRAQSQDVVIVPGAPQRLVAADGCARLLIATESATALTVTCATPEPTATEPATATPEPTSTPEPPSPTATSTITPTATLAPTATSTATATAAPTATSTALPPSPTGTPLPGVTLIVAPDGLDTNLGTAAAPLRTLARALTLVTPGTTILLREGTYTEDIRTTVSGTAAQRITIQSAPGERATVRGLIWLTLNHVTVRNLSFTWNTGTYLQHMVKLTNGTGWVFEQNDVSGARSYACLLVYGAASGIVRGNTIHDCHGGSDGDPNKSHDLYINDRAPLPNGLLVEDNVIRGANHGYNVKISGAQPGTPGSQNVTFRNNHLENAGRANLLIGNPNAANILVEGNTFAGAGDEWNIRLWQLTGSNLVVRGNSYDRVPCGDYDSPTHCAEVIQP